MARTWTGKITKGIMLEYSTNGTSWTEVEGVQNIPDIGGNKETIETTCFDNEFHTFIGGLKSAGDAIEFTLLHNADQFVALSNLVGVLNWRVSFPDGEDGAIDTIATFSGECSAKIAGASTNEALHDTLSITVSSDIIFA